MSEPDAVAVVGAGCRLPGGIRSLDALWDALAAGRDLVGTVPPERFDAASFTGTDPTGGARPGASYTAAGGFLADDLALFDADYFGMSPKEAARVDPQQRLLLECAVEALDDAGIDAATLAGSDTAVVVGASTRDYFDLQLRRLSTANAYSMSGSAVANTANRVSHFLDLRGPSLAVDTACSSALMAVHQACAMLRARSGGLALVGGVNLLLGPGGFVGFSQASMLSTGGRCRPFSALADGFVRAEGAGVVVLKPLGAALADGDRVHAVIVASGANSDGRTTGLSLPNPLAQADLLRQVYAQAGISPEEVAYVEAHGTGTPAGDPLECEALGRVLGRRGGSALPIGSVKSNLGHLEAAAGLAGLLKAVLVLREQRIPATLHAQPLSEAIDFAGLGLEPVTEARPLAGQGRRVVGVNSFGFGGANVHAVLAAAAPRPDEPAEEVRPAPPAGTRTPVLVSARTAGALTEAARAWADRLGRAEPAEFHDLAFTACRRRTLHEHRTVVLAEDAGSAAGALRALADGGTADGAASATAVERGRVAFVFCGNGAQWHGMGRQLLAEEPAFAAAVAAVDDELTPGLGWSVLEELARPGDPGHWRRTDVAQPLLFAVQAGLVGALAARGIRPSAVAGHSVGEVAAAYCSGALDLAAACRVVVERGKAQARTAGSGRMAAVGLGAPEAGRLLADARWSGRVVIAGINSDHDVTVAGDGPALAMLGEHLTGQGVFFRDLVLDYAFHSPAMDAVHTVLKDGLSGLTPHEEHLTMISTVTGGRVDGHTLDADHWWRNLREPVRFASAVTALTGPEGCDVLVQIGPHPVLDSYLRSAATAAGGPVAVVPTMRRTAAGHDALDTAQAHLLAAGAATDWTACFPSPGRVTTAPSYPWQRERHWNGSPAWWREGAAAEDPAAPHPLLGARQPTARPAWQRTIGPDRPAWLTDHRIGDALVMPAAAYVALALAAARTLFEGPVEATGVSILRPLTVPSADPVSADPVSADPVSADPASDDPASGLRLHCALSRDGEFTVSGRRSRDDEWVTHARCRIRKLLRDHPPAPGPAAATDRPDNTLTADDHYAACARAGMHYGPALRILTRLHPGDGEVLAHYAATLDADTPHEVHPAVLDGALQAALPLLMAAGSEEGDEEAAFLPTDFEAVRCWRPLPATGTVRVSVRTTPAGRPAWDVTVADEQGTVALELLGARARRFDAHRTAAAPRLTEVLRAAPLPGAPSSPSPLPAPADVLASCAHDLTALPEHRGSHPYARVRRWAQQLSAHFTAAAVRELLPGRAEFTVEDLLLAGALPRHVRLLRTLITAAADRGVLAATDTGWRLAVRPDPQRVFRDAVRDVPGEISTFHTYGVCGRHLTAVLRGTQDPLELLLSGPDSQAARYYDANCGALHNSRIARLLVRALVTGLPADRPLRVLEVGAGTGSTTALILPELPTVQAHYTYTDTSTAFFPQARARFRDFPHIDYRRLDLETDPGEQGFTDGAFDLVIASNVLHATHDLTRTLGHVGRLLADNGHLLALESHDNPLLAFTFGLMDSYWHATDTALRPDGPLLARDAWPPLLEHCGFTGTVQVSHPDEPARGDYSALLTARRPRSARTAHPVPTTHEERRHLLVTPLGTAEGGPLMSTLRARTTAAAVRAAVADTDPDRWAERFGPGSGPVDVVLLTGPDRATAPAERTEEAVHGLAVLRAVAVAAGRLPPGRRVTLWLITCGAVFDGRCPPPAGTGAALWGAARSLANEHPGLRVRKVALTGADCAGPTAGHLATEILADADADADADAGVGVGVGADEDEVLLTPDGRFVSRLVPFRRRSPGAGQPVTPSVLTLADPGTRYRLDWRPGELPVPGPGEIVVRVAAVGLNYRDVLTATALIPLPTTTLGLEYAGTVTAVGPGVRTPAPGDRVMGLATGCLASHVRGRADRAVEIPEHMSFAEAATVPAAFLTVRHGLGHLARLGAGETVLVHGGAGGVGLAAVQYAQHVGARVIATAGSRAKRDLLHLLGVEHVLPSRGLGFVEQVRDLTGGEGVDVLLNSLAGEAMVRGLDLLRPEGRFVELGKRDFLEDNPLPLGAFDRALSFFGVDILPWCHRPSALADGHLAAIREALHHGVHRPLPHRTYPAGRVQEAFTCLQHSRHTGKLVITLDEPVPPLLPVPPVRPAAPRALDARATYLVTGGLGGFGAATAAHLAARGARHLTLVGRRGARTPEAPDLLADLERQGVDVTVHAVDAADLAAMRAVMDGIDASGRRLAGVVHAAMVLDDAPLRDLPDDRVRAVLTAKMTAGHVLDDLTRHRDLDFFVVHSSAAVVLGNVHQAPYVAGNLALEALVRERRRTGLPGLAVQWGVIAGTGHAHRVRQTGSVVTPFSAGDLSVNEALSALDELMADPGADVVAVCRFDWGRAGRILHGLSAPRTAPLLPAETGGPPDVSPTEVPRDPEGVTDALVELLAGVLQTDAARIDRRRTLEQLGVDSLMAAELTALVQRRFGCAIPTMELLGGTGLTALAERVLARRADAVPAPT
ncbi:type I polyketide synthase [Streptomyces sp. I05A-00742]|uniref:type I polyketide synthase n=1 Tax=Streptomyces sp. I05A-00742 TaxID=2732853 RepID=UPI001489275B|nr:type I polyketide synthase [Streptomyces sp. I05A-00742]